MLWSTFSAISTTVSKSPQSIHSSTTEGFVPNLKSPFSRWLLDSFTSDEESLNDIICRYDIDWA